VSIKKHSLQNAFFMGRFCNLETTKVLKFPKIFGCFVEKQYLCTVFDEMAIVARYS
jgi:hypothetical protein